jgi:2-keto-myo-inositol isomerase
MINRRSAIQLSSVTLGMSALGASTPNMVQASSPTSLTSIQTSSTMNANKIRYCLNTSTIHGEKIAVPDQIKIASKAGYDGIELWLRDVDRYLEGGGKLPELRKMLADSNLRVESAIAFGSWIVDDDATRKKGIEQCARDMEVVRELGGRRIAAPPVGATDKEGLDLDRAAERYRALLEVGRSRDCVPQLEVWGFSKNLHRLCQVLYICAAAQHPDACILPDIYHLYKGGSDFSDVPMLPAGQVHVFHMNDYPADPPRASIGDQHRVYPGDGIAPIAYTLQTILRNGFSGVLSLELFNRSYWEQDPYLVAQTGLDKMKAIVA